MAPMSESEIRLDEIRRAEAASHTEAYTNHQLYSSGSWLAKPVKTVLELLPLYDGYTQFRGLDLGCGVGRNSIALAQAFADVPCRIDCVDILDLAIEKLWENARKFRVSGAVRGIVSSIDDYVIPEDSYDLILAVSALEHTDSKERFMQKLTEIRDGLRSNGIVCLIVNSGVSETDKATKAQLPAQFEVNFQTSELKSLLADTFRDWEIIKYSETHQKYDIPRESGVAELEMDVVTYVARKKEQYNG